MTHQYLETHKAMFTAAKRCKAVRLLEIVTTRECHIKNFTVRCPPLSNCKLILETRKLTHAKKTKKELLSELPQLATFSIIPVPMSEGLPPSARISMATNLAEGMMHAAVARSKRFTLLSFTNTKLDPSSDRRIYLRHRESPLPLSYDVDGQQQC